MKISNSRIEYKEDKAYLVFDVECSFSKEKTFWYSLPSDKAHFFSTDVYDTALVAFFYAAMCYNEDIVIDGCVSKRLYKNLISNIYSLVLGYRPAFHRISIEVSGFCCATQNEEAIVGTGFSCGVDSFATLIDHYVNESDTEYRINSLFFFHLGQYGDISDPLTEQRARLRYEYCKRATDYIGLPYIFMDTNLFKFYQPSWEYDAGVFCRCSAILALQSVCRRYYVSGAYSFCQSAEMPATNTHDFASYADPIVLPMFSTERCEIVIDGCQYKRIDKINLIKNYIPAQKYLNVCVNSSADHVDADNCGICGKCKRTLFALESLGALNSFSEVFDLEKWRSIREEYLRSQVLVYGKDCFATENIDCAREAGIKMPTYLRSAIAYYPRYMYAMLKYRVYQLLH